MVGCSLWKLGAKAAARVVGATGAEGSACTCLAGSLELELLPDSPAGVDCFGERRELDTSLIIPPLFSKQVDFPTKKARKKGTEMEPLLKLYANRIILCVIDICCPCFLTKES